MIMIFAVQEELSFPYNFMALYNLFIIKSRISNITNELAKKVFIRKF